MEVQVPKTDGAPTWFKSTVTFVIFLALVSILTTIFGG